MHENILNALIVLTPDKIIKTVNPATEQLLKYSKDELIGQPVKKIFSQKASEESDIDKLIKNGTLHNIKKTFKSKNNKNIQISLTCSVIHNSNGAIEYIILAAQDISEFQRIKNKLKTLNGSMEELIKERIKELISLNEELKQFAYIASHDLQEPLRKVIAFGDRLKAKCGDMLDEQGRDYLERMQNAGRRMQALINGLLTFSRVMSTAQPFEPVDLATETREVLTDLEILIEQTKGNVEVGDMPTIDADPLQMRQLLQNLISNALKFHKINVAPIIKISSNLINNHDSTLGNIPQNSEMFCQIRIEDNGIGFDVKYLQRIFGVFQRLHGRSEYEGTGIGLSVCRKIAERHNGDITAISTVGEGSTFIVTLPLKQENGANDEQNQQVNHHSDG